MIRVEYLPADVLGLSALERDALSGRSATLGVARRAEEVPPRESRDLPAERAHLAKWLEARATIHAPHVAVLESIRSLQHLGASCVVCEAFPQILLGPWSQLLRALQTIALARRLSTASAPVVPVLWNHGDVHDAEALRRARLPNRFFELQTLELDGPAAGRAPIDQVTLETERHGLGALREVLRQLYGDYEHIDAALDVSCPREGESLTSAFTRGMYELLGAEGLVVVEPSPLRTELSHAAADVIGADWVGALRQASGDDSPLLAEAPLVHVTAGGCQPLYIGGEGYRYDGEPGSRTAAELAAEVVQEPGAWRVGAPLRPLTRDLVLPVRAVVGDADALAHHAALAPVRAALELPKVAFVPATCATLVDGEARDSLARFEVDLAEVLRCGGGWEPPAVEVPGSDALERLAAIEDETRARLAAERRGLVEIDPTLLPALKIAKGDIRDNFRRLAQKVEHAQKNRAGKALRHTRRLNARLCPDERPQAEVLPPFTWLARQGPEWIGQLLGELDPFGGEHLGVHLP